MCNQEVNTNKGYYLPPDTYPGIFSVPAHPGYIVILVAPHWNHPNWCDDLNLSGTYMCFTTLGRIFFLINNYFTEQEHITFAGLFIKICNTLPCSTKDECNLFLEPALFW